MFENISPVFVRFSLFHFRISPAQSDQKRKRKLLVPNVGRVQAFPLSDAVLNYIRYNCGINMWVPRAVMVFIGCTPADLADWGVTGGASLGVCFDVLK